MWSVVINESITLCLDLLMCQKLIKLNLPDGQHHPINNTEWPKINIVNFIY